MISNSLTKYNTRSQSSILRSISFSRRGLTGFLHGGRRYFSRREIIALVGGPGNYRHMLVIPPTASVVTDDKRTTPTAKTLPPKKYAIFSFYRFHQKNTNSRYRQKVLPTLNTAKRVPPTLDTAQKVPPTLDTAQKVPPTLDIAQKVPPILDTAEKVPRTLDTAQKVPAFLFVFVLCSLFFLVLRVPFR